MRMKAVSDEDYVKRGYSPSREDLFDKIDEWYGEKLDRNSIAFKRLVIDIIRSLSNDSRRKYQFELIYMHYFMSISIVNLAYNLGKSPYAIEKSIARGLKNMEEFTKNVDHSNYKNDPLRNSDEIYKHLNTFAVASPKIIKVDN